MGRQFRELLNRPDGDLIVNRVTVVPGTDDPEMLKVQIILCDAHGLRNLWRLAEFELGSITASPVQKKEVEFCATIGGPEKHLRGSHDLHELTQGKPFP